MRDDVPPDLRALLLAATQAWRPLPVQSDRILFNTKESNARRIFEPPGGRPMTENVHTGDLVLIPHGGMWEVAVVLGPDDCEPPHDDQVKVAYVGADRYQMVMLQREDVSVFYVQRNNCHSTRVIEGSAHEIIEGPEHS